MDNLTHSLVGALLGQAGLKKKTGLAMPALIIGANLPDVDAACLFWLEGVEHVGFRRGITHGPPAMVLLPLILAWLLWVFDKWQAKRGTRPEDRAPVNLKWLFLLSFIGCLTHPALDWLNVYGVRLLEPFSSQWYYGDTLFIIDVWLWGLMGFATWFSLRQEREGGDWAKPARIALAVGLTYIGVNWVITKQFENMPKFEGETSIANPVPIAFWDREVLLGREGQWMEGFTVGGDQFFSRELAKHTCQFDRQALNRIDNAEARAFLFWSRAPFAEQAPDGSVLLRDARFYDPLARDRFTVELPNIACEPIEEPAQ
jgi:inner membrane protein